MNEIVSRIIELINAFLPTLITTAIVIGILTGVRLILYRRFPGTSSGRFRIQMILLLLSFAGMLSI